MASEKILLTKKKKEELEKELDILIHEKRAEASEKLRIARGFGDLSENAEYDEAKDEQAKIELRIVEIEQQLKNVELIDEKTLSEDTVSIGSTVKIKNLDNNKEMTLTILGTLEADIKKNIISNESPLGKALLNSKIGDIIDVKTKIKKIQYEVLEIVR